MTNRERRRTSERQELRSAEDFRRYSERHEAQAPRPNAEAIARIIARKHCAGRKGTISGRDILEALRSGPDPESDASRAVQWMLGSVTIPECTKLVVRCGVRYEDLARYVRERPQKPRALVRYLNQFTIGGKTAGFNRGRFGQ